MQIAMLLERFGFEERAFRFGYRIFLENPENPEIHFKYMALLLQPNKPDEMDLNVKEIGTDTVFVIENGRGEIDYFLIEKDEHLRMEMIMLYHQIMLSPKSLWGSEMGTHSQ